MTDIRYITHSQIDKKKWDECVFNAANGRIYGHSWYLDHMAGHWDGLVSGDYEKVMPLPWKKKWGFSYIYQPFLTAQLGIFGNGLNEQLINSFINAIPSKFKLIEYPLNSGNLFNVPKGDLYLRKNYCLPLLNDHEMIFQNYRENIRRNIRKAVQLGCITEKGFDVTKVVSLAVDQMNDYGKAEEGNVSSFLKLYHYLEGKNMATTYGISLKGELLSSCVFFYSHNRAYYILVGNHPNGKTIGASHMLIDSFIKDHAGKKIVLDFEGSDIRNLAFFYSSFGAVEENYPAIKMNRLPFYIRWLK